MTFKLFVLGTALAVLGGCVSAPYSPDTGYTQASPPATTYYVAPTTTYYAAPGYAAPGYVVVAPGATPASICTATPAGC